MINSQPLQGIGAPTNTHAPVQAAASYISWSSTLCGAAIALAVFTLLSTFGTAVGLSAASAVPGKGFSARIIAIATGLWIVWTIVTSLMAGSYFAGRLQRRDLSASEHETEIRDGSHGLLVWALVSLIMTYISVVSIAAGSKELMDVAAENRSGSPASLSQRSSGSIDPFEDIIDRLVRPSSGRQQTQDDVKPNISRILGNIAANLPSAAEDKAYLQAEIAARTGSSQAESAKRVDDAISRTNSVTEQNRATAEQARKTGIIAAFLTAASLAVAAAASWWAATTGGKHRDEELGLSHISSWNYRKSLLTDTRS